MLDIGMENEIGLQPVCRRVCILPVSWDTLIHLIRFQCTL